MDDKEWGVGAAFHVTCLWNPWNSETITIYPKAKYQRVTLFRVSDIVYFAQI